eukprot:TRINITY_DN77147_c0_g1_i1.p1 TRINITY_DN77147_c0_g1~~TRINITY_DN77147_c0_g1_i1.p1  ORF type:complete len:371 (+),score=113.76 TRINITY_DN77147_c0_g1_i1:93-1115(+)
MDNSIKEMVQVVEVMRAKKAVQRQFAASAAGKGRSPSRRDFEIAHAEMLLIAGHLKETRSYKIYKSRMRHSTNNSSLFRQVSQSRSMATDTSFDLDSSDERDIVGLLGPLDIRTKGNAIVELVLKYSGCPRVKDVTGADLNSALLNIVMSAVRNMRSVTETRLTPREVYIACPDLFRLYRVCHDSAAYPQFRAERESLKKDSGNIKVRGHGVDVAVPYAAHLTVKDLKRAVHKATGHSVSKISLAFEGHLTLEPQKEMVSSFGVVRGSSVQCTVSVSPDAAWMGGSQPRHRVLPPQEPSFDEESGGAVEFIPVVSPASHAISEGDGAHPPPPGLSTDHLI